MGLWSIKVSAPEFSLWWQHSEDRETVTRTVTVNFLQFKRVNYISRSGDLHFKWRWDPREKRWKKKRTKEGCFDSITAWFVLCSDVLWSAKFHFGKLGWDCSFHFLRKCCKTSGKTCSSQIFWGSSELTTHIENTLNTYQELGLYMQS